MANSLLLRLGHSLTEPVRWLYRIGNQAEAWQEGELDSLYLLSTLPDELKQSEITVLIPGDAVLFREVQLNGKVTRQTLKALPYLIEESLISDVEQLHLVTLAREQSRFYLMGVDISQLQMWLDGLQQAGIVARRLLPDVLAVPYNSDGWNACRLGEQWLIRTEPYAGVAIKTDWVDSLVTEWRDMPPVTAYSDDPVLPHHWQRGELAGMRLLENHSFESLPDLLQGRFKPRLAHKAFYRWYLAAGVAIAWLLFSLLNIALDGYQYHQQAERLKQQQLTLFQQIMPSRSEEKVDDPRQQLQEQLSRLQTSALEPGFIWLLKESASFLRQLPQGAISALHYESQPATLRLTIKGVSEQQLQAWGNRPEMVLQVEVNSGKNSTASGLLTVILRQKHG